MNITQVRYVLAIAEHQNFSKAADQLFLTQPALSLQISKLEKDLGFPLFYRMPKGVFLTEAGKEFCEKAQPVLSAWDNLQNSMKSRQESLSGAFRVGIGPRVYSNHLFGDILSFFEQYPEIRVTFITEIAEGPLDKLTKGQLDVALDRFPPLSLISDPNQFMFWDLITERYCVLLSHKDPACKLAEFPFQEMHGRAIISGPENSIEDKIMKHDCQDFGISVTRTYRSDNVDTIMSLVREGKGVVIGPESFAAYYGVASVPILPETYISLRVICLKQNRADPRIKMLKNYLIEKCKKL